MSATEPAATKRVSFFCEYPKDWYVVHRRGQVDPIVSYGQPVSAHLHDTFGQGLASTSRAIPASPLPDPVYGNDPGWVPKANSPCQYGLWSWMWFPTPKYGRT